jgi:hypothetical protein
MGPYVVDEELMSYTDVYVDTLVDATAVIVLYRLRQILSIEYRLSSRCLPAWVHNRVLWLMLFCGLWCLSCDVCIFLNVGTLIIFMLSKFTASSHFTDGRSLAGDLPRSSDT